MKKHFWKLGDTECDDYRWILNYYDFAIVCAEALDAEVGIEEHKKAMLELMDELLKLDKVKTR